jgi:hypothetical protein
MLPYSRISDGWTSHVVTVAGTPLDQLRLIGERVASFCGWPKPLTTMFVLTGKPPHVPAIGADIAWKMPLAGRSRIVLTIDPTCPPHEVEDAYRKFRQQHFSRLRRLSPLHTKLAVFALQHSHLPAAEQMGRWNRTVRQARYRKPSALLEPASRRSSA